MEPTEPQETEVSKVPEEVKDKILPEAARDFTPGDDAIFFTFSDGKKHRRIFSEPQEYSQSELIEIDKFMAYLRDNGLELPEGTSTREAYKHIVAAGKYDKAFEGIYFDFKIKIYVQIHL